MKQLCLQGVSPFAPAPIDAPDDVVTVCASEEEAVRWSIEFAIEQRGMSLRSIAKACGWKSPSFLSEIASDANPKALPPKRIRRFTLATGIRLVEQFHARQEITRRLRGACTPTDRAKRAVAAMLKEAA